VETKQDRYMGRPFPRISFQVPLEPADPAGYLRDPKSFLGRSQPFLDLILAGRILAHGKPNASYR